MKTGKKNVILFFSLVCFLVTAYFSFFRNDSNLGKDISNPLPIKYWDKNQNAPLVFYLSGDAGFNTFSKKLCQRIFNEGHDVYSLNSKSYFWNKKTPEICGKNFSNFLEGIFKNRKNQQLVLIGYSFGADALPFVLNALPLQTRSRIKSVILIDPSTTGNLEINIKNYFSEKVTGEYYTIPEVNRIQNVNIIILLSDFDSDYPYQKIYLKDKIVFRLPGGHRFNYDYKKLSATISKSINNSSSNF